MADQSFGVKQLNLLGSGVPTIQSPSDLNLNANNVAISTNLTVGNKVSVLSTGIVTSVSGIVSYYGSGIGLTALNASNLYSGTVPTARLGSGSSVTTKFLRGDNTWQTISATPEGTAILSTGESGGTKFLREDGDGSCSWQSVPISDLVNDTSPQLGGNLDVNTKNNCSRFLAFFLYLTNNKEGSTIFTKHNVSSSCTKGSLLVFPPNWIYLHSGEKCVETNKYIVGSYAHYIK